MPAFTPASVLPVLLNRLLARALARLRAGLPAAWDRSRGALPLVALSLAPVLALGTLVAMAAGDQPARPSPVTARSAAASATLADTRHGVVRASRSAPRTAAPGTAATPPAPPAPPPPPPPRFVRPDVGPLSSGFGMRWGRMHEGIDLAGPYGSPVLAVADGTVIYAGEVRGYGNFIELRHGDGTVTAYGHLARILVRVGQPVPAGFQIGLEGSTGHSTGPHLHFEVRVNGVPVNPLPWLLARGVRI